MIVPEVTLQLMDRREDSETLTFPETAEPVTVECEPPKVTKGCDSVTGEARDSVRQRPVRKRVRPKRYEN